MAGKKYEVYVQKGRPWWKILTGILFSNAGMFVLNITYACIGAYIFILIELPAEEIRYQTKLAKNDDVEDAKRYLKTIFWVYANSPIYNFTFDGFQRQVTSDLDTLTLFVVSYSNMYKYDAGTDWDYSWTFPNSLLFTLTIITTIGYGNIVPKTIPGKMFCIAYALLGIPLLLVFMAKMGDVLAVFFRWIYSRICCRWCRVRRRDTEMLIGRPKITIGKDDIGKEGYMPTDMVNVPIMVCLLLIIVYLFIGSFAFASWEDWVLGTSLYFCFITLTTIGFGDKVPTQSFLNYDQGFGPFMKMVFTLLYIIFGIAMLSMCIQLMQEEIVAKVHWLVNAVGMGDQHDEEMVKVSKVERLKQTPSDMTGNELDFNEKRRKKNMKLKEEERHDMFFEEDEDEDQSDS